MLYNLWDRFYGVCIDAEGGLRNTADDSLDLAQMDAYLNESARLLHEIYGGPPV
jgi:hypothetical protein